MKHRRIIPFAIALLLLISLPAIAQQKLLTIDDIFDPAKKINFNGTVPNIRWLKDGRHYLLANDSAKTGVPKLQRIDAVTGEATPFFNSAKFESALMAVGGITQSDAKELANRSSYQLNNDQNAVLINWKNDLLYYELGSETALGVTNNPEEEVGETFSPDGRRLAYIRSNDMYVFDLNTKQERRLTTDGGSKILNGRLDWVYQE
ncbi:MAG: DPP IV N-terminal domain-containing protein, partial [Acidobacteriota bacterium]|nr:DPP IV N-terminal domain-containing protein [Acidobacteriota bacterium]